MKNVDAVTTRILCLFKTSDGSENSDARTVSCMSDSNTTTGNLFAQTHATACLRCCRIFQFAYGSHPKAARRSWYKDCCFCLLVFESFSVSEG